MVEVVAENLSAVWKIGQYKTLQTSTCRVLAVPEVLTLYGQAWGRSYWQDRSACAQHCTDMMVLLPVWEVIYPLLPKGSLHHTDDR